MVGWLPVKNHHKSLFWLVVYLPLWKMMEFVSWAYEIPNRLESHRIPWFQSPPTSYFNGWKKTFWQPRGLGICHVQLTAVSPSHFKQSQFCGKCCAAQVIVVSIWQKPRQEPLDPTKNLGSNNDPWLWTWSAPLKKTKHLKRGSLVSSQLRLEHSTHETTGV